jgi:probable addiction module antidote protein
MVEGRSKHAFKTWLAERPPAWRDAVEVVAIDGFTGFKTATTEELPDAVAVIDPLHVVRLAGDALDQCRRRVQQAIWGHRGRAGDPLYAARRTLHTGADLLTDRQRDRLVALFAPDAHVEVKATWGIYQRMIAAYRHPDRAQGREQMTKLIDALAHGVAAALSELVTLGRTLKKRAADVLAYFDRPRTSNGPTEAINGRLEEALEEAGDDPAFITQAIGVIARSQNFSELARKVDMSREGLYKALSNNGNPSFATIYKVARALGLKLEFQAVA